jgi:hypothetical protein
MGRYSVPSGEIHTRSSPGSPGFLVKTMVGGQKDGVHRFNGYADSSRLLFEEVNSIGKAVQSRIRIKELNISRQGCAAIRNT